MLPYNLKSLLLHQKYKLIGNNAAVKLCQWTKSSIRGKGSCYKEKFYGIKSHRCLQCTPCVNLCTHNCVFCWRSTQYTQMKIDDFDDPEFIVDNAIIAQRTLLSGFWGFNGVDRNKLEEAQFPNQAAISLSGEPTLYDRLPELIEEFHKRNFTTFVVSNGTNPSMLEKIRPTQLYLTIPAPDKEMYRRVCNPLIKDGWEKLMESIKILAGIKNKQRTVVRLTLVRGLNMVEPKKYANLISEANPDYIELKAYMAVGFSRGRLGVTFMPLHDEIKKFADEILKESSYLFVDEHPRSRVVLLARDDDAKENRMLNAE